MKTLEKVIEKLGENVFMKEAGMITFTPRLTLKELLFHLDIVEKFDEWVRPPYLLVRLLHFPFTKIFHENNAKFNGFYIVGDPNPYFKDRNVERVYKLLIDTVSKDKQVFETFQNDINGSIELMRKAIEVVRNGRYSL